MINEREKSKEIFKRLKNLLPGGVNSPTRAFKGLGVDPLIIHQGFEDMIEDVDGNQYIDFNLAWGSLILGHLHPSVVKNVKDQISRGTSFGITTEIELKFAAKLNAVVPSIEKSRVVASGTEATMTAIRLARGYTKRNLILKFNGHYHGHSDAFLIKAGSGVYEHCEDSSSKGVPKEVVQHSLSIPFNDIKTLFHVANQHKEELAAIILEPIAGNMGVVSASFEFIEALKEVSKLTSALIIFDEVITGFRVARSGAQSLYGISPDLTTFSKIIGGGFPVGVLGGRKEIMDMLAPNGNVYQAGTLSGNPVALSAGIAVLEEISKEGFYQDLIEKSEKFLDPIQQIISNLSYRVTLNRSGPMFSLFFGVEKVSSFEDLVSLDKELFNDFFKYLFQRGIYISPSAFEASFISSAHKEENLRYSQKVIIDFLLKVDQQIKSGSISKKYDRCQLIH